MGVPMWFWLACLTPFFNAMVNVVDVYFAKGVYKNAWDGAAVSCLYKLVAIPSLIFYLWWTGAGQGLFHQIMTLDSKLIGLAFLAGICYSASSFFYFRAIMAGEETDVVFIESIFNLTAVVVPIMAIVLLGKWLTVFQWAGVFLAVGGALVLITCGQDFSKFGLRDKRALSMLLASIALSFSIIIENKVYAEAPFVPVFAVFCLGCFATGCFYATGRVFKKMENLAVYTKRFFLIFVAMETLELLGALCQEGTVALTESYYLSTIYCAQPVFALLISYILCLLPFIWNNWMWLADWVRGNFVSLANKIEHLCRLTKDVGEDQRGYFIAKMIGIAAIIAAVALVTVPL